MKIVEKDIKILYFSFVVMLFSILVAKLFHTAVFLEGIMVILLLVCSVNRNTHTVIYFVMCTVFQNVILVLMSSGISSRETTTIIILKESLVYICAIVFFLKNKIYDFKLQEVLCVIFVIVSIFNLVRAQSINLGVTALRQITIIVTCYYFGCSLKNVKLEKIFSFIVLISVIVGIIGIGLFFLNDEQWIQMGYADYWNNKTGAVTKYSFTNFYTYDLGVRLKRLVSTFVDPLACSHFIGIGFLVVFIADNKNSYILKIFITILMLMGITKSSVVLIVSTIFILNYSKINLRYLRYLFLIICIIFGLVAINILSIKVSSLSQSTSISNHFNAFIYGLTNATLLGNGLGTTGYNALIMGLENYDSNYNESFFALSIAQIGIVGVITIYGFLFMCIKHNYKLYRITNNKYILVILILSIDLFLESFFSASSISMLGTGLYCVLNGISYSFYKKEVRRCELEL